jgi:hypothetical protein
MQAVFDQVRLESSLVTSKRLYAKYKFQRRFSLQSAMSENLRVGKARADYSG